MSDVFCCDGAPVLYALRHTGLRRTPGDSAQRKAKIPALCVVSHTRQDTSARVLDSRRDPGETPPQLFGSGDRMYRRCPAPSLLSACSEALPIHVLTRRLLCMRTTCWRIAAVGSKLAMANFVVPTPCGVARSPAHGAVLSLPFAPAYSAASAGAAAPPLLRPAPPGEGATAPGGRRCTRSTVARARGALRESSVGRWFETFSRQGFSGLKHFSKALSPSEAQF